MDDTVFVFFPVQKSLIKPECALGVCPFRVTVVPQNDNMAQHGGSMEKDLLPI